MKAEEILNRHTCWTKDGWPAGVHSSEVVKAMEEYAQQYFQDKLKQKSLLIEMMQEDEKNGMYEKSDKELIGEFMGYGAIVGEYDTSWDWLMPVVEKIKKMENDPNEMFMGTTLDRHFNFQAVLSHRIYAPIAVIHTKVVWFIKWYNQQSK